MRLRKRLSTVIHSSVLAALFALAPQARADLILGFPNGLTGWNTAGDANTVTASGGQATITESFFASETDLFINFTVPTGAQSVQFTLVSVAPDSTLADNQANGYTPDSFGASLLNPNTLMSLVPTVDQNTDSFYIRDVVDGVTQGQAAMGVTASPLSGTPTVIALDISSLGLAGQSAQVLFRLIGGTDPNSTSTVTLSNVEVIGGTAVPEPSALVLASLGFLCCAGFGWQRRSSKRHPARPSS
jgi:hypothetical protein